MTTKQAIVPARPIEEKILLLRGHRVMMDADLAEIYGVQTRVLNQAVKRQIERFPRDFMFPLTKKEKREVVTNCDHLARLKFSTSLPLAFTEHGAIMAATVLNSPRAIQASLQVVRAFVKLRQMLIANKDLARKLDELEQKYDQQFSEVFEAIRQLMGPPARPVKRIGFKTD